MHNFLLLTSVYELHVVGVQIKQTALVLFNKYGAWIVYYRPVYTEDFKAVLIGLSNID